MTESEAVFESEYYVNTTSKHIMWDGSEDIPDDLLTSIEALITISTRAKQKPYENQFIDILNSSGICLSPSFFVKLDGWHINFRIAKRIVETNPLAQSIYSELKNAGAFEFLNTSDVEKKGDYRGRVDTLIAIFCSCTNGFSSIEEMPKAVVTRLYSYFRTEDNMKWNRDLFGINSDAWVRLIEEIQNRWNRDNPSKQINLFVDSDAKNNSKVAIYNPHGLRVRGISKLVSAGIPIELAMKITGHSTIAMLLYYYHDVPSEMNNMLNQKMVIEIQEKSSAFIQNFTNSSFEEAKRIATYRSEVELTEIVNLPLAAKMIEYTNMDLGICPYNGARCHDGNVTYKHGSGTTRAETEKNYGPVPSAKYGCLFCRHLISGPPWLMQLWLLGNSLLEHITKIRAELETLSNELDNYERSVVDYKNDKTTMSAIDIRKMQYVRLKNEEEEVETAIFLVTEQVMAIKKIMAWEKENGCESSIALLADRDLEIHFEEMSPLVKTSILSIGGKYYPIVRNSEHNARLTKYVDQALFDSGMKPISLLKNLTDQEKLHCVQQTALSNLSRRETTLIELDVNEDVENLLEAEIGGIIHLPRGDYRQQQLI